MQKTQHTQQTDTRTAQIQDKKQHEYKCLQKHRRHTETNKHLFRERWENRLGTVSDKCHWGFNLVYERSTSPSSHLSPTKRTV